MRYFKKKIYRIFYLFCLILLLAGCTGTENRNSIEIEMKFPGLTERNIEWIKTVNSKDSLNNFYNPSAVLLFENEWYLTQEEIQKKLYNLDIRERVVLKVYEHSSNEIFEVGEYILADGTVLKYLTACNNEDVWFRKLEVIYKKTESITDSQTIKEVIMGQDSKWQKMISLKDVEQLIDTLFWKDARYFSLARTKYTTTYKELLAEYTWLESPNDFVVNIQDYHIVSNAVIYLIGQYRAFGGQGLFTLILTKNKAGVWKYTLDANY